jgi:hypothetical protein
MPWNVAPQKTRKTVLRVKAEAEEIAENFQYPRHPRKSAAGIEGLQV